MRPFALRYAATYILLLSWLLLGGCNRRTRPNESGATSRPAAARSATVVPPLPQNVPTVDDGPSAVAFAPPAPAPPPPRTGTAAQQRKAAKRQDRLRAKAEKDARRRIAMETEREKARAATAVKLKQQDAAAKVRQTKADAQLAKAQQPNVPWFLSKSSYSAPGGRSINTIKPRDAVNNGDSGQVTSVDKNGIAGDNNQVAKQPSFWERAWTSLKAMVIPIVCLVVFLLAYLYGATWIKRIKALL